MTNIRLLVTNYWNRTGAVVTASSAVTALPAAASQNPDRSYVWRSNPSTGEHYLTVDLGAVLSCDSVAIASPKVLTGGGVKLQQLGDGVSAGTAVDVVTLSGPDAATKVAYGFFTAEAHRWWRVVFTNQGALNDYVEAGYIHLGPKYAPSKNVAPQPGTSRSDPSTSARSVDGQESFTQRTQFEYGRLAWRSATETLLRELQDVWRTVGRHTPWFCVLDADRAWTAWLCRFESDIEWQFVSTGQGTAIFNISIAWKESL